MVAKRVYGFDYGKGLAVLGMLVAHTFEAGICDWDHTVELNYVDRIPRWVVVVLSPFALILLMGLFFTFITSITCTMNIIRIESKGKSAVMGYFLYRLAFAFVLKFVQLLFKTWWSDYGIFHIMAVQFPAFALDRSADTLDSVGACGFLVPVVVYLVRRIPKVQKNYISQVVIITTMAVVLLLFYIPIANFFLSIASWLYGYNFNLLGLLCNKIGDGGFMIAMSLPFGLVGACIALIMVNTKEWKALWIYASTMLGVAVVVTGYYFLTDEDPFTNVLANQKPCFVRFCELGFETLVIAFAVHLSDNKTRPLLKRYQFNKHVTFLRRISCVSLSCYIYEAWVSRQLRKIFAVVVGNPYDAESKETLWSFWVVGIFMIVNVTVDLYIIAFWEKIQFRFSCEHVIAAILSWLFNKKEEVDWKANNKKIIYGPINDLEKEIIASEKSKGKKESSSEPHMVAVDMSQQATDIAQPAQVSDKQEMQLMSTLISMETSIDKQ